VTDTNTACLKPECARRAHSRGLCHRCYDAIRYSAKRKTRDRPPDQPWTVEMEAQWRWGVKLPESKTPHRPMQLVPKAVAPPVPNPPLPEPKFRRGATVSALPPAGELKQWTIPATVRQVIVELHISGRMKMMLLPWESKDDMWVRLDQDGTIVLELAPAEAEAEWEVVDWDVSVYEPGKVSEGATPCSWRARGVVRRCMEAADAVAASMGWVLL